MFRNDLKKCYPMFLRSSFWMSDLQTSKKYVVVDRQEEHPRSKNSSESLFSYDFTSYLSGKFLT